jgi:hypothetical protein
MASKVTVGILWEGRWLKWFSFHDKIIMGFGFGLYSKILHPFVWVDGFSV